jgi:hypothetical protein
MSNVDWFLKHKAKPASQKVGFAISLIYFATIP